MNQRWGNFGLFSYQDPEMQHHMLPGDDPLSIKDTSLEPIAIRSSCCSRSGFSLLSCMEPMPLGYIFVHIWWGGAWADTILKDKDSKANRQIPERFSRQTLKCIAYPCVVMAICFVSEKRGKLNIHAFPIEILEKIFLNLEPEDLRVAAQVCRHWNEVSSKNIIWKTHLRRSSSVWASIKNDRLIKLKSSE